MTASVHLQQPLAEILRPRNLGEFIGQQRARVGFGLRELLRAGVKALAAMSDIQFKAALSNVPTIKTGRPKNSK